MFSAFIHSFLFILLLNYYLYIYIYILYYRRETEQTGEKTEKRTNWQKGQIEMVCIEDLAHG